MFKQKNLNRRCITNRWSCHFSRWQQNSARSYEWQEMLAISPADCWRSVIPTKGEERQRWNWIVSASPKKIVTSFFSSLIYLCILSVDRVENMTRKKSTNNRIFSKNDPYFQPLVRYTFGNFIDGIVKASLVYDGHEHIQMISICVRCSKSLTAGKVPKFSIASGFQLCNVPVQFSALNDMETRLIVLGVCLRRAAILLEVVKSAQEVTQ